jgi:hypothetical protein
MMSSREYRERKLSPDDAEAKYHDRSYLTKWNGKTYTLITQKQGESNGGN